MSSSKPSTIMKGPEKTGGVVGAAAISVFSAIGISVSSGRMIGELVRESAGNSALSARHPSKRMAYTINKQKTNLKCPERAFIVLLLSNQRGNLLTCILIIQMRT
jgi:hypothetical protein